MPSRRVLAALLLLSLAVHVFAAAYWGGSRIRTRLALTQPVSVTMAYRIAKRLPEPASTALQARLDALKPQLDEQQTLYSEALARGASQLARDEVDQAALKRAIEEARGHRGRIGDLLTDAFVSTVTELPAASRKQLVERFVDPK